jgi:imidazolonepropionase-like amidohydrolase
VHEFLKSALLFSMSLMLGVAASRAAGNPDHPIVIRGATILTMTHGSIEGGTVVIENGKITAVGKDVQVPSDAEVIDARG